MTASPEPEGRLHGILGRLPWYTVPAILLGVPALAGLLSLASRAFYDHVVWKYYWGPIVADGSERHVMCTQGSPVQLPEGQFLFWDYARWGCTDAAGVAAAAGYNAVNTISWAILLFVCVLGAAQLLLHFRVTMGEKMILAATAWVVTGSVFHVLQDAQLFEQPLEFLFITPPIWLIYAAFGVGSMVLGVYFQYVHRQTGSLERALQKVWFLFAIFVLIYTFLWLDHVLDPTGSQFHAEAQLVNPVLAAVFAMVAFVAVRALAQRRGTIEPWHCVATFSIGWFLLSTTQYVRYTRDPWPPKAPTYELDFAIWLVPLLASAVAGAVYLVARWLHQRGNEAAAAFMRPINLVIVVSQMWDAFSTAVGVDLSGYEEKHVLSEGVRRGFEGLAQNIGWDFGAAHPTFIGFASVKLLVSLLVVYAIDVSSQEDAQRHPTMMNLIKLAVIMVGIGPGMRNTLRMTIGI